MSSARLLRVFSFVSLMLFGFSALLAQSTGGRILGRITDPSGAVLSGAKVTITNEATGVTHTAQTNSSGDYVFLEIPAGEYTVEFEQPGFKKYVQRGVTLRLNDALTINRTLDLGGASETVDVSSEAPLVDTTTTQLGAVVNDRAITQLPLNSRDTYQFLQLQPGVQSQVGSDAFYGSDRTGVVSVNGGRGRSNNFSVNGGDANDIFANLPAIQPSPDTVQEFRVITNTFDAEYGRNSGAVVNVVTKSGTNQFHGNAWEFFRNKALNAKGYFDLEKPDFKQNQFGGTFGGPIKRDNTFFFVSYEGRRVRRGIPASGITVMSEAERNGDFSGGDPSVEFPGVLTDQTTADVFNARPGCTAAASAPITAGVSYAEIFPNAKIPRECMDPTAVDLMTQFIPSANVGTDLFSSLPGQRDDANQFTARFDHRLTGNQQLSAYYFFDDGKLFDPFAKFQAGGASLPGFGTNNATRVQQWNFTHTWTLSNSMVNEARFSYFRQAQGTFLHPQRTNLVQDSCATVPAEFCFSDPNNPRLGITPALGADREGVPFISIAGGASFGNNFEGELPQKGNTFQWTDNISKVAGSHTMKFGGDVRRARFDQTLYFDVNGFYTFNGLTPNTTGWASNLYPDYLLGLPDSYLQGSAQTENVRSTSLYLFAQDSWKVKPNLTLNYGLRWEFTQPMYDTGNRIQTFRPGMQTTTYPCELSPENQANFGLSSPDCNPGSEGQAYFPLGLVVPGDKGISRGLTQTYYKAFAPRIGLSYSPSSSSGLISKLTGGPNKTSIRTGWGLFYNPIEQLVLEQFSAEPPFGGSSFVANTFFNLPFLGQDGTEWPNPFNGILSPKPGSSVDWSSFRPILLFGQFQPDMRPQYSAQYNFTIQRELGSDFLLQLGYVGSQGHRLLATHDVNYGLAQPCLDLQAISDAVAESNPDLSASLACGPGYADSSFFIPAGAIPAGMTLNLPYGSTPQVTGPNATDITLVGLRPYSSPLCEPLTGAGCPADGLPVFSSIFAQDTVAHSSYNSLQVLLEKRYSRGLQFQAAYTFSKSIDNASSFENILDPLNFERSTSLSLFDARHRFVFSWVYELPIKKMNGVSGKLLNGWSFSGIAQFQSGFPIQITSSDDNELMYSADFFFPGRPDLVVPQFNTRNAHDSGCAIGTGPTAGAGAPECDPVSNQLFDPNQFAPQALGSLGNSPRSLCCGPGVNNWDMAFHKNTPLTEGTRLEFRAEFFNVFNHTQFALNNGIGNITNGSDFGRITRNRDPRLMQFALKYFF